MFKFKKRVDEEKVNFDVAVVEANSKYFNHWISTINLGQDDTKIYDRITIKEHYLFINFTYKYPRELPYSNMSFVLNKTEECGIFRANLIKILDLTYDLKTHKHDKNRFGPKKPARKM